MQGGNFKRIVEDRFFRGSLVHIASFYGSRASLK
jgi:hypothetical protein